MQGWVIGIDRRMRDALRNVVHTLQPIRAAMRHGPTDRFRPTHHAAYTRHLGPPRIMELLSDAAHAPGEQLVQTRAGTRASIAVQDPVHGLLALAVELAPGEDPAPALPALRAALDRATALAASPADYVALLEATLERVYLDVRDMGAAAHEVPGDQILRAIAGSLGEVAQANVRRLTRYSLKVPLWKVLTDLGITTCLPGPMIETAGLDAEVEDALRDLAAARPSSVELSLAPAHVPDGSGPLHARTFAELVVRGPREPPGGFLPDDDAGARRALAPFGGTATRSGAGCIHVVVPVLP